jgi:sugar lactone lactonase YvrE
MRNFGFNIRAVFWALLGVFCTVHLHSQIISTIAGTGVASWTGDGGPATSASVSYPHGVNVDNQGNIYIADHDACVIRKIDGNGIITTVAGSVASGFSGDGGLATSAKLNYPTDVVVDNNGNLFIADCANGRIRRVDTAGIITTFAGNGVSLTGGDFGPATQAGLWPYDLALDNLGNLFIACSITDVVRKIDANGIITTVAGNYNGGYTGDGGLATAAQLNNPMGIAVDLFGNLYIADSSNNCIRKINSAGIITTIAGNGNEGFSGDNGPATIAMFYNPVDVILDNIGNIYVTDTQNSRVRKISSSNGIITTIAGNGSQGFSGDGGLATTASIYIPLGIAINNTGNLIISDCYNKRIRQVTNVVGISENLSLDQVSGIMIWPVPVTNILQVKLNAGGQISRVEIFTFDGKKIYERMNESESCTVIIGEFEPVGLYILRITDMQDQQFKSTFTVD